MKLKNKILLLLLLFCLKPINAFSSTSTESKISTNSNLENSLLDAMEILNHLPTAFPEAISLAPGKPAEKFCEVDTAFDSINIFKDYVKNHSKISSNKLLGQYGKINGIINEIIAKHLKIDENIETSQESIIVTVGFQEAATLTILTLFNKDDVLIVPDPGYIGITGIAAICGIATEAVQYNNALKINEVEKVLQQLKRSSKNVKALYIASNYCNPQGGNLSLSERRKLLDLADQYNFFIIEDATYSLFNYDEPKIPSLKSLDKNNRVIYIGSFAKSIYPALRIGYIVFDHKVTCNGKSLTKELIKAKSFVTINTPSLDQAVVGGILLKNNYSLKKFLKTKKEFFQKNRDIMIAALEENFSGDKEVSWTYPKGGFFLTVTLPFKFTYKMLEDCAKNYQVIVLPMSLLSLNQQPSNQVRLSFTTVEPEKIKLAIQRFSIFVKNQILMHKLQEDSSQTKGGRNIKV